MSSPSSSSKYTILIVDDNPELLESLRFAISLLGDGDFHVETATDGAQGLERVVELRPDCVIIDVKMPTLNGYQLVHALRGDPETASIPLVILSAMVQARDTLAGMLAGADQYLTKPAHPRTIVEAIRSGISLTQGQRDQRLQDLVTLPLAESTSSSEQGEAEPRRTGDQGPEEDGDERVWRPRSE
jgi:CheY-like chemotaxis protein